MNIVKFFRDYKNPAITTLIGIIFIIIALVFGSMSGSGKGFEETNAVITEITDENDVFVEYEVNGKKYENELGQYVSSYKVGKTVKVKYNPEDPGELYTNPAVLLAFWGMIGMGLCVYGILTIIRRKRENDKSYGGKDYSANEAEFGFDLSGYSVDPEAEPVNEYLFHHNGKMNQGHLMETPDRKPVYEAILKEFNLVGKSTYEFVDYKTGKKSLHKIGKTATVDERSLFERSWFSLDGENIWKLLHESGIDFQTEVRDIVMNATYTVLFEGEPIAKINTAGTEVIEGVKENWLTKNLAVDGLFKISCAEVNVPLVFLAALALARTNQYFVD